LGCSNQDATYYDYEKYPFPPPGVPSKSTEAYQILDRLGTGKFSDVFSAAEVHRQDPNENYADGGDPQTKQAEKSREHLEVDPDLLVVIKVCTTFTKRLFSIILLHISGPDHAILRCLQPQYVVLETCDGAQDQERIASPVPRLESPKSGKTFGAFLANFCPAMLALVGGPTHSFFFWRYYQAVVLPLNYYESQRSTCMVPMMPSLVLQHAGPESQWLCHPTVAATTAANVSASNAGERRKEYFDFLSEYEIKYFLYHLLVALDGLHSKGYVYCTSWICESSLQSCCC